jgi:hypothetical protein
LPAEFLLGGGGLHGNLVITDRAGKRVFDFNGENNPRLLVDGGIRIGTTTKGLRLTNTGGAVDIESFGVSLFINNGGKNTLLNPQGGGNVGIGTTNPQAKLHVDGDIRATGDIILENADCAEEFAVDDPSSLEAGTVMVIGSASRLRISDSPYNKRVAGIIAGAKELRPGVID